jgi:ketosteroid isomerase-like protein
MSKENVEVVRQFLEAYNRRDFERMIELIDPSFEFWSRFVGIESAHRAPEGFPHKYFEMLDDAYDHFEVIVSEYIDAGAAVVTTGRAVWRGKASHAEGETPVVPTFWLRAGKVLRTETFADRAEAVEAVGLSTT